MTDKANITISLAVDLTRLGALISLLTKSDSAVNVSVVEQPSEAVAEAVAEQPVEETVAEAVVDQPSEAVVEAVAEQPVEETVTEQPAEQAVEVDYYQLCEDIATKLRVMAKDGRRKEAKDIMLRYKVTALSKLNTLDEDAIVALLNELREY